MLIFSGVEYVQMLTYALLFCIEQCTDTHWPEVAAGTSRQGQHSRENLLQVAISHDLIPHFHERYGKLG